MASSGPSSGHLAVARCTLQRRQKPVCLLAPEAKARTKKGLTRVRQPKVKPLPTTQTSSKHVAAMDIGSNTVHVTVARKGKTDADLEILADESDLVRLGHDVGAMGALGDARAERAIDALRQYTLLAGMLGCETILCVATGGV